MIKYPNSIKYKDTIGITATSDIANIEKIDMVISNLKSRGYNIVETDNVRKGSKFVSSDGKTRADEFIKLWDDDQIKHIIAARGGEFLIDMIPYLDQNEKKINSKIKWVQGFSDTSLLLFYLTTKYNIATLHAENAGDFAMKEWYKSLNETFEIISTDKEYVLNSYDKYATSYEENIDFTYILDNEVKYKDLYGNTNEKISGRLIGGCIDCITQLIGTKYDYTKKFCSQFHEGMIWYIDNCELTILELYRRLNQCKSAGWFDNANGFLIGRTMVDKKIGDFDYEFALKKALQDLNVPVIYDVDIGHVAPQWPIINGAYAQFEFNNEKGRLTQIKK